MDLLPVEAGPFVLRTLLDGVPLSADGTDEDVKINCVEYLDNNLYVGTSASELLHFVQIPPDPADRAGSSVFILASRLRPAYSESSGAPGGSWPGVQQILLLPQVGKACILCNWTVTFYTLPELSPAFTQGTQVKGCYWIGGVDLNEATGERGSTAASSGVTILVSTTRRIMVVRIGDEARVIRRIEFAGSTISVRRDSIACVADSRSYALLHVEQQLKIPLMSISSLDNSLPGGAVGQIQNLQPAADGGLSRSASSAQARPHASGVDAAIQSSHGRSTSLGGVLSGASRRQESQPQSDTVDLGADSPARAGSPAITQPPSLPPGQAAQAAAGAAQPASGSRPAPVFLRPHIASPTPDEFLIVTGTGPLDPGLGIFVNTEGDPSRPTLEFDRYPKEIVVDGGNQSDPASSSPSLGGTDEEGYVLASMTKEFPDGLHHGLEIQRWDINIGEDEAVKYWLEARDGDADKGAAASSPLGVRSLQGSQESLFQEVVERLCQRRLSSLPASEEADSGWEALPEDWEDRRNREEEDFAARLARTTCRLVVWSGSHIWWAMRNPLILRLEAAMQANSLSEKVAPQTAEERRQLFTVLNSFRGKDAKTELEFMTFNYIRQRAGALLFMSFLRSAEAPFSEPELRALDEVLLEGGLDPRVILALVGPLRREIIQSRRGVWIFGGVKAIVERYLESDKPGGAVAETAGVVAPGTLQFLRRFLTDYRRKKGFGSIADEDDVFRTVDAALLTVLLELDRIPPKAPARTGDSAVRADLYDLVDKGVNCFDRAVELLESYHRLFVLSRLYQSRKMAADVLATWKRILEGERDDGGDELQEVGGQDGEQRVREYLSKISNQALVQEYGLWLAKRNPRLGVQVFADDKARAPKFEPTRVVSLLRERAPAAVKYYLEHLVFGKGYTAYVGELITYYLDIVIAELQSSAAARQTTAASYEAYRALRPPKPTYRQFLTDNAPPDDEVWHSRLRLLQLLGGGHEYDAAAIRARIAAALPADQPAEQLLVPETIILDGREHLHEDALRLLVHGLGDYDTAVAYCLRGGASLYESPYQAQGPGQEKGKAKGQSQIRRGSLPPPAAEVQGRLFRALLREFLALEDVSDRVEQTGALLERFGGWFDVAEVLELLPDAWPVEVAAGFLVRALAALVREGHEAAMQRALGVAEHVRLRYEVAAAAAVKVEAPAEGES